MCVVQVGGAGRIGGREIVTVSVGGVEMGGGSSVKERGEGVDEET